MSNILAGGGLIYRISNKGHIKVLLIKRKGFWDLPKGKLEPNESIEQCAAREIMEEIGLNKLPMILRPLCETTHQYKEKGNKFTKYTSWYLMHTTERKFKPQTVEKIQEVRWEKISNAYKMLEFDTLREVLDAFMQ